jgi:transposase
MAPPPCTPEPKKEAYLRVEPLIGEQAQVDWAHAGQVPVPGGQRALWLFVQVLIWSRALWGEFVLDTGAHSLARSLVRAAGYFGGTPRQWLFDNPKAAVPAAYAHATLTLVADDTTVRLLEGEQEVARHAPHTLERYDEHAHRRH